MDTWTKSKITHLSVEATRQEILKYAVTVIDRKGYGTASGTLVEIGDRLFVATASHVIPNDPQGRLWLVKSSGSYENEGFPSFVAFHKVKSERPDVGLLERHCLTPHLLNLTLFLAAARQLAV